jgi:hypothetical protein
MKTLLHVWPPQFTKRGFVTTTQKTSLATPLFKKCPYLLPTARAYVYMGVLISEEYNVCNKLYIL